MKKVIILIMLVCMILAGCSSKGEKQVIENGMDDVLTANKLIETLVKEEFKKAYTEFGYDSKMEKAVNESVYKQIWDGLIDQQGEFVEIIGHKEVTSGEYNIVSIHTKFEKGIINLNVVFDKNHLIAGFNFTPYTEESEEDNEELKGNLEEVKVTIVSGKYEMEGRITLPNKEGVFPAVLLVPGSGPSDMNETLYENKPFRDIAWGLAEKGIASLRFDKRTKTYGLEMSNLEITVKEEYLEDVESAFKILSNHKNIDSKKIYILGHSQGGNLIPRIAEITDDAAGFIMAAANASSLEDLMIKQYNYIFSLDGKLDDEEKNQLVALEESVEKIKNLDKDSEYTANDLLGAPKSYWIDLKENNAYHLADKVTKPLLLLQGGKDYQVTMDEFELWKEAFEGKKNVQFKVYDNLNHLWMESLGQQPSPEEYKTKQKVSEEVIEDIVHFVLSR
ncbi:MAG: DUF3887 domain-containing protein [Peptostreptococcales bacterium]